MKDLSRLLLEDFEDSTAPISYDASECPQMTQLEKAATSSIWYTEYFGISPCIKKPDLSIILPEEADDFDQLANDQNNLILPCVFYPDLTRAYRAEKHNSLNAAIDYIIDCLGSELASELGVDNAAELFAQLMQGGINADNSVTFLVESSVNTQDYWAGFIRLSQRPLRSIKAVGNYYTSSKSTVSLAKLMDSGIVADPYSAEPNFGKDEFAYQGK